MTKPNDFIKFQEVSFDYSKVSTDDIYLRSDCIIGIEKKRIS